ncbi:MAG: dihydroorotase, partial [Candidatus Nanopelagicales bacterium]
MTLLIKNVKVLGETAQDVLIENQKIVEVKPTGKISNAEEVIDAKDKVLLPGLVDLHTHLRQPGREDAETVLSGARAAACGGYTAVHAMANTNPVADTAGVVEQVYRLGEDTGLVSVHPVGAVTVSLAGSQLAELKAMADSKAKVRIFSDDGKCVEDSVIMRRALEYVKAFNGVVAQHAQESRLSANGQMNESALSATLGLTGWPNVAEEAIVARDILLCELVDSRLHICHASTKGTVELLARAKDKQINVTAEVTPHHLLLDEDFVKDYNPVFKVNPPLRHKDDVLALREALASGVIDVVATDHAPHPLEDKETEWASAAFGMLGLENALSVVATVMVHGGKFTWRDVARVMSKKPAEIAGHQDQGQAIEPGSIANLCLVDPNIEYQVDARNSFSL